MRTAFGAQFDIPDGYLNTPSIGVPPVHAGEEVAAWVDRWRRAGTQPADFDEAVARGRQAFADLIGAPGERVAVGASVSQMLAVVAAGLRAGARVLVAEGEFTSVTFPFAAVPGVSVTEMPLEKLPEAVAGHDLVAVSVVQSADGAIVDLDALRAAAEAADVPVVLDASQAAGWLPLSLEWADWVVAAGYKWLLSPRGSAWLAVHPRALDRGRAVSAGWYAGEDPWQSLYGMPLRLAGGARRYDLSPVWLAQVGAAVALPYLASLDLEAVRAHCVGLADTLLEGLGLPARGSAIVSFDADPEQLQAAGVVASARAGRARIGFHLYNTLADLELVLRAVR
ncbi:aminotransferase class V-fold PLP-dependent enzyme [Amycolatopsis alkalitolerans]|uniref:Aminotransferase class V-fold PLP-dependent enzyme n=1 Tax=Amycolatopsis alkalitolerans TaxID=2547244 RepID=A0A5C4M2L6_9PSEU|nr:aminotransferase class V-fold PLP-dependent enzyme [Amycolatopsis alkalitolerans]TNC24092.1 aminotransferase class V-fold PLP-dependent enzyme [Amycolatopsis alkalitolerans]